MNRRHFLKSAAALVAATNLPVFAAFTRPRINLTSGFYQIVDGKPFARQLGATYAPRAVLLVGNSTLVMKTYRMRGVISGDRDFVYHDELVEMLRDSIRYERRPLRYLHSITFMWVQPYHNDPKGYRVLALRGSFARCIRPFGQPTYAAMLDDSSFRRSA